jgi:hypothetical protein
MAPNGLKLFTMPVLMKRLLAYTLTRSNFVTRIQVMRGKLHQIEVVGDEQPREGLYIVSNGNH